MFAPRPQAVPMAAQWQEDADHWQLVQLNAQGHPEGPVTLWRRDGSLLLESQYVGGVLQGPFRRYHPNGALAREGQYVAGEIEGVVWAHTGGGDAGEPLRGCCVPVGAERMEARFDAGNLRGETFFDDDGFVLLSDGRRRPERPTNVPASSRFEESSERWCDGDVDRATGSGEGLWSWWRQDGSLSEEADYDSGHRTTTRHFDETGQLKESIAYLVHDSYEAIAHGPWRCRLSDDECVAWGGPQQQPAWLHGHFDCGQSVGQWQLVVNEAVVWQRHLGVAFALDEAASCRSLPLFGPSVAAQEWIVHAQSCHAQGRVRDALVAHARAVAMGAPVTVFTQAHAAWALPKGHAAAQQEAQRLGAGEDRKLSDLLEGLVAGAEPGECLRLLCTALPSWSEAARDLIEASVALDPTRTQSLLSRAFVRFERADDKGLQEDLQALAAVSSDSAAFFDACLHIFRPTYGFAPTATALPPLPEAIVLAPTQPLEQVQHVAKVYATRLLRLRSALAVFVTTDPPWAPPDLGAWLPEGPIELECEEAQIEDENEQGEPELTQVQIDETLNVDDMGVSALIRRARADWAGLCWLLWAVGQDEPRLPKQIKERSAYVQALNLAVERAWRARDQVVTSGLRSMNQGIGSFEWEGFDLGELPRSMLDVCLDEYLEMRAVLLWLSNPGNLSPFQSDLRHV